MQTKRPRNVNYAAASLDPSGMVLLEINGRVYELTSKQRGMLLEELASAKPPRATKKPRRGGTIPKGKRYDERDSKSLPQRRVPEWIEKITIA
jgi:hypothetical protein